jgi:hypothetical protein
MISVRHGYKTYLWRTELVYPTGKDYLDLLNLSVAYRVSVPHGYLYIHGVHKICTPRVGYG